MEALERATGALLGLFVGDALGAQTEGMHESDLLTLFPQGIEEMYTKDRIVGDCGEITERSELAILLAQSMLLSNRFDTDNITATYRNWLGENPSLVEASLKVALESAPLVKSESNGALSRIVPVAIYGSTKQTKTLLDMAEQACMITHRSQLCIDSNKTYALALVESINEGTGGEKLVGYLKVCAAKYHFDGRIPAILNSVSKRNAASSVGKDKDSVLHTLQIVLKTLLETSSFEAGMKQIVIKGGSACSNAAIYGSLAGAFYGPEAIPDRWVAELQATDSLTRFLRKQSAHRRFNMNLETMASDLATRLLKN